MFILGSITGAILVSVLSILNFALKPSIAVESAYWFFAANMQVNATLLVAIFIVASYILPRLDRRDRLGQFRLFKGDVLIVALGMVASGLGILLLPNADSTAIFTLVGLSILAWGAAVFVLLFGITTALISEP